MIDRLAALEVIRRALRQADDGLIDDVTVDRPRKFNAELVLTLDDGQEKTRWILAAGDLQKTDVSEDMA